MHLIFLTPDPAKNRDREIRRLPSTALSNLNTAKKKKCISPNSVVYTYYNTAARQATNHTTGEIYHHALHPSFRTKRLENMIET